MSAGIDLTVERAARMYLPAHGWDAAIGYVQNGYRPGSFLCAVLRNDLIAAAENADDINRSLLYEWACFVYNAVPMAARGSQEAIDNWVKLGGLHGERERREGECSETHSDAGVNGSGQDQPTTDVTG